MDQDKQREKVYFSETRFTKFLGKLNVKFEDHLEAQAYADYMVSTDWWKVTFPQLTEILVKRTIESRSYSIHGKRTVWLTDGQLNIRVLLHEVAHLVTDPMHDPGHGRNYTYNYLVIVAEFIGHEESKRLKEIFEANEVKVNTLIALTRKKRGESIDSSEHMVAYEG